MFKGNIAGFDETSPANAGKHDEGASGNWPRWRSKANRAGDGEGHHDLQTTTSSAYRLILRSWTTKEMLEDLIAAAMNDGAKKVEQTTSRKWAVLPRAEPAPGMKKCRSGRFAR